MEKNYWISKWQEQDTRFDQVTPNASLVKYLPMLPIKKDASIFVPLCGKSVDMLWLIEQGYQVIGVELSEEAVRRFFIENNIDYCEKKEGAFKVFSNDKIVIYVGDFFDSTKEQLGSIELIYDRAAIIALPIDMRKRYAKKIIELSPPKTAMLLLTIDYDQNTMNGPPFSVSENEVMSLYSNDFNITKLHDKPGIIQPHHFEKGLRAENDLAFKLEKT